MKGILIADISASKCKNLRSKQNTKPRKPELQGFPAVLKEKLAKPY